MKHCRNCETPLLYDAEFCHICGQKFTDGKHSIMGILTEFIDALFSLDSRTLRSVFGLSKPSFLTRDYFRGRQVRYMHPLRVFLLSSAIFLGVFGLRLNNYVSESADNMSLALHRFHIKKDALLKLDSVYNDFLIVNPGSITEETGTQLMTCFEETLFEELDLDVSFSISNVDGNLRNIPVEEIYTGNIDSLAKKYNADTWGTKIMLAQMIKFTKTPNAFIQTTLGNMIWTILLLMPAIAMVLKLLYFRRDRYFVEHLVFSFHFHSFAFLVLAFQLGFFPKNILLFVLAFLISIAYLFIGMRKFYKQSYAKTFGKWVILLWSYLFIFLFFFVGLLGASFATF